MPLFQQQLYKTLHVLCNLKKLVFCRGGGLDPLNTHGSTEHNTWNFTKETKQLYNGR